jgi:hypothetical protein
MKILTLINQKGGVVKITSVVLAFQNIFLIKEGFLK